LDAGTPPASTGVPQTGVPQVDAGAKVASAGWAAVSPYLTWILVALGVALAVAGGILLARWWRRRRRVAASSGPPPMSPGRMLQARRAFFSGLPWASRAAVVDLPNVVVLGPAGSGKTRLIGLDVDWERQARQFLPSHTTDPLLQLYLGPDCVVQEVSAPLLEDESLPARTALRRMWQQCFSARQKGLAAIVLDVRWLSDTPPDEQRRTAQLLRGKLNLISEACGDRVETRLCLTHMDGLEGFEDFARLLKRHGAALSFEIPQQGEEDRLTSLLGGQEQYLALGLTSLPADAFERLERFYSQGGRSFAGLGRFASALLEGDTLSFKPRLTRVYLSSPTPEARAGDALSIAAAEEGGTEALHRRYRQAHLRRAALIAAVGTFPVVAAYVNFYRLLGEAEEKVAAFEGTVANRRLPGMEGKGDVERQVSDASDAMSGLWRAASWWPPLDSSFPRRMMDLRKRLADGIRENHLRPPLEHCHRSPGDCRPEEVVYLLAALHASNGDELGKFVQDTIPPSRRRSWRGNQGGGGAAATNAERSRTWLSALNLNETLLDTYIQASDRPWERDPPCRQGEIHVPSGAAMDWPCWSFRERLTLEGQLKPWLDHLACLRKVLDPGPQGLESGPRDLEYELENCPGRPERLKAQLADLDVYASLHTVLNLLDQSAVQVNTSSFQGVRTTVEALDWLRKNRDALAAVLHMEEEARAGYVAAQGMSSSELLTRNGLWLVGSEKGPFRFELLQQNVELHPQQLSRELLKSVLDSKEKSGKLIANTSASESFRAGRPIFSREAFDADLKPLVDDFSQRLNNAQLSRDEAARREEYVKKHVAAFSLSYREGLHDSVVGYQFPASRRDLLDDLSRLVQPSSPQVDMLQDVAKRANLEPLDGPYYEPLRNAVAPYKPIVQLMVANKDGAYDQLADYHRLVNQMHDALDAASGTPAKGEEKAGKEKPAGGKDKAADGAKAEGDPGDLADSLTPLERVALSMLLEEEGSYLRRAHEWLDQKGLNGELRRPFLEPFLKVRALGKQDLESTLARQWREASGRMLRPMLERYPFNPSSQEEVDPGELEVLRHVSGNAGKEGAFWLFVNQSFSRVCVERGSQWGLRGPLRGQLELPDQMLVTLSRLSRLSKLLWDEEGRQRPLMLKVQPQPLPPPPLDGVFVTMSALKCGKTTEYGFNQIPNWRDFPVYWWDQQVSSIGLELRSPPRETPRQLTLPWDRSSWSCFRLFEEALLTADQRRQWSLALEGNGVSKRAVEISFGVKGEPWLPFREVPR
jgi:type VI secretion system protein ImpL